MKGVLFDLDGTLINSLEDIGNAMNRVLLSCGLKEYPMEAYKMMVGNGARMLTRRAVGEHREMEDRVYALYVREYTSHALEKTRPYPGIMELLKGLREKGIRLCVFSNKPDRDTHAVVDHFFPGLMDAVQGQREDVPIKPAPEGAWMMARSLDLDEHEMGYLGDSGVDMMCARAAGMHAIGALWGFRDRSELTKNGAEHLIAHPLDLLNLTEL